MYMDNQLNKKKKVMVNQMYISFILHTKFIYDPVLR